MELNEKKGILEIKNLTVYYGLIKALEGVNLKIAQGEMVVLFGANGAGKSTLLKSIAGQEKAAEGSIIYQGKDICLWNTVDITRAGICLIPEEGGIFRSLTVEENLQLGAYNSFHHYRKHFDEVIQLFPILKQRLKQVAGTLSGGEQKMLSVGKALMYKYQILMFDEPSLGLSPFYTDYIFKIINRLHHLGYTILLSEQNINQGFKYAQRIYLIERGEIILEGKADEVREHPKIIEAYFGSGGR